MNIESRYASESALAMPALLESCHIWLTRNRIPTGTYSCPALLALDYGNRGTHKFFPLHEFSTHLATDERFKPYIFVEKEVRHATH